MSIPIIFVDDRDTQLRAAVGVDPETNEAINISTAQGVYLDVKKPSGNWVTWTGYVHIDNNSIVYNMVAADYEKGEYIIHTRVKFTDTRIFRGKKYYLRIIERGEDDS